MTANLDPTLAYAEMLTIEKVKDEIRRLKDPRIPLETLERIRLQQNPDSPDKKACKEALKPLLVRLMAEAIKAGRNYITMREIRNAAMKDPFLRRYANSIGQRVRDLVKEGFLRHVEKDGEPVVGHYVLVDGSGASSGLEK